MLLTDQRLMSITPSIQWDEAGGTYYLARGPLP